ncbi:HNH endonuclease signature motif containing protein [Larkinella harenae]
MATKKDREMIFSKFGGKCAYCGCDLPKNWHVDELLPCVRNHRYDRKKGKFVHDGTFRHPERLNIDNQMPACPSCNINKHSMSLEDFRRLISGFLTSLNRDSTQYKIAKRYGFIQEIEKPVIFYFEQFQSSN